jgi:hypothetical protein
MSAKDQHSEPPVSLRERVTEALDGTITITKRVVAFSLIFILLFVGTLSAFSPFWVRRLLRLHTDVVWLPYDPQKKMSWAVHNEAQCAALVKNCQEFQQGGASSQQSTPRRRGTKRQRR